MTDTCCVKFEQFTRIILVRTSFLVDIASQINEHRTVKSYVEYQVFEVCQTVIAQEFILTIQ